MDLHSRLVSKVNNFIYENRFDGFKKLYNLPLNGELASRIVYIHKNNRGVLDVDNLSKPFVDAFSGIIYVDELKGQKAVG